METVYVDDSNQAYIVCPMCGFEKTVDVMNFRDTKKRVKAKCKCKGDFQFTLEYRKHYRKVVRLPGEYRVRKSGEKGEIVIRELSLSGIRFESLMPHRISTDDILEVKFKLDDPIRSEIRKLIKVIWVKDRAIGANVCDKKLYEKDLGFYLRN